MPRSLKPHISRLFGAIFASRKLISPTPYSLPRAGRHLRTLGRYSAKYLSCLFETLTRSCKSKRAFRGETSIKAHCSTNNVLRFVAADRVHRVPLISDFTVCRFCMETVVWSRRGLQMRADGACDDRHDCCLRLDGLLKRLTVLSPVQPRKLRLDHSCRSKFFCIAFATPICPHPQVFKFYGRGDQMVSGAKGAKDCGSSRSIVQRLIQYVMYCTRQTTI